MSEKNMLSLAICLASSGFANVYDKGGNPYFLHCYRVAEPFIKSDVDLAIIGLLHDVVEDNVYFLFYLLKW